MTVNAILISKVLLFICWIYLLSYFLVYIQNNWYYKVVFLLLGLYIISFWFFFEFELLYFILVPCFILLIILLIASFRIKGLSVLLEYISESIHSHPFVSFKLENLSAIFLTANHNYCTNPFDIKDIIFLILVVVMLLIKEVIKKFFIIISFITFIRFSFEIFLVTIVNIFIRNRYRYCCISI